MGRALTPSWCPTPTVPWPPSTLTTLRPPPSIRRPSPRLAELTSPSVFTPLGLWYLMCMLPTLWSMAREMLMLSLSTTLTAPSPLMTPTLPLPPTHTLPPGLDMDTTDPLSYTERGRLRSPSALRPDTLPSMPDTPSTTDMAWLP